MAEDEIVLLEMLRKATADGDQNLPREEVRLIVRRGWRPRSPASTG